MIFLRPLLILSIFSISIMNLQASHESKKTDWRDQDDWAHHLFDENDKPKPTTSQLQQQAKMEQQGDINSSTDDSTDSSREVAKPSSSISYLGSAVSFVFQTLENFTGNNVNQLDETDSETKSLASDTTTSNIPTSSLSKIYTDKEKEAAAKKIQNACRKFIDAKNLQDLVNMDIDTAEKSSIHEYSVEQELINEEGLQAAREAELARPLDESLVQSIFDDFTPEKLAYSSKYPMKDEHSSKEFKEALRRKAIQDPAVVQDLVKLAQQKPKFYQFLLHISSDSNSSSSGIAQLTCNEVDVQSILEACLFISAQKLTEQLESYNGKISEQRLANYTEAITRKRAQERALRPERKLAETAAKQKNAPAAQARKIANREQQEYCFTIKTAIAQHNEAKIQGILEELRDENISQSAQLVTQARLDEPKNYHMLRHARQALLRRAMLPSDQDEEIAEAYQPFTIEEIKSFLQDPSLSDEQWAIYHVALRLKTEEQAKNNNQNRDKLLEQQNLFYSSNLSTSDEFSSDDSSDNNEPTRSFSLKSFGDDEGFRKNQESDQTTQAFIYAWIKYLRAQLGYYPWWLYQSMLATQQAEQAADVAAPADTTVEDDNKPQ